MLLYLSVLFMMYLAKVSPLMKIKNRLKDNLNKGRKLAQLEHKATRGKNHSSFQSIYTLYLLKKTKKSVDKLENFRVCLHFGFFLSIRFFAFLYRLKRVVIALIRPQRLLQHKLKRLHQEPYGFLFLHHF